MILAATNIRQTPVAKVSASMGMAVSRLKASFKSLIRSRWHSNSSYSTSYHSAFAQNFESAITRKGQTSWQRVEKTSERRVRAHGRLSRASHGMRVVVHPDTCCFVQVDRKGAGQSWALLRKQPPCG